MVFYSEIINCNLASYQGNNKLAKNLDRVIERLT